VRVRIAAMQPGAGSTTTVILLRAARAGDRAALDQLFQRYAPLVRRVVALRMGRPISAIHEHEDIVQEAVLKAFQGLEGFEPEREGAFRNWLCRCVESAIVDALRRSRAKKRGRRTLSLDDPEVLSLSSPVLAAGDLSPGTVLGRREDEEMLHAALLELKQHHREIIIKRQLCQMSYGEIAAEMGLGQEATVRKAHERALRKLRESMGAGEASGQAG
jgi:RNA polymerase sigma-70 factor (ECF subfamily)